MMEDYVVIGKILDTFGLEGELKVKPFSPPEVFENLERVYLKRKGGDYVPFEVEWIDFMDDKVILKFKGYDSIDEVEQFRGAKLFLPKEELPKLEEEEYYAYELVGMEVETDKGKKLGRVQRVQDMGPYDALVLDKGNLLIPFVSDIVLKVDKENKKIVVKEELLPV
ncbi:MAG: 16S rRNA processing protein RimM [Aquifex sp.]|nr:MAG: 16S rRNA processing protein RimM [Aquifex sp.]